MKTLKTFASVSALVTVLALAAGAHAATISGLYNTGVDNSGVSTTGDGADLHWQLNGGSAYTGGVNGTFPIGPWVSDSATSRWLTPTPNAGDSFDPTTPGDYTYSTTFSLTSAQALEAAFTGQFAADNTVVNILLNGNSLGGGGSFSGWTSFSATSSDFQAGTNTLDFVVENFAQNGGNPTGLDVQFTSSVAGGVPEPAAWALSILGVGLTGMALRRAKSQPVLA
jgi:hypothetical protein